MTLPSGTQLGPYEILAPLGAGGMGQVYRARDPRLGRDVAIKVLHTDRPASDAWDRFEREARAASALSHPNICPVYDVGESDGRRFLVMELVDGVTLGHYIDGKPLGVAEVILFGRQIARALEAAHSKGILHRDIKPGNIMVSGHRHLKVLDFGLARTTALADSQETAVSLTGDGTVVGTAPYLSPEVLRGSRADARADVWALGIVLYEMLTGHPPFSGPTAFELGSAIVHQPVPPIPASVPPALRLVVERCLEKRPDERYQHAAEVAAALETCQTVAAPVDAAAMAPRPVSVRRWKAWVSAGAAAGALGAALLMWSRPQADVPRLSTGGPASSSREANDAFELAMQFQGVQNDIPRANQALDRAVELDPVFSEALRYRATNNAIAILNGYTNDTSLLYRAEQDLREVSRLDSDHPGLPSAYATVYLTQGRRELIPWSQLERALQQDPSHVNNRLWRGIALWLTEDRTAAMLEFRTILERQPLFGPARMFAAEISREEGDHQTAIVELRKVMAQAPNNIAGVQWLTFSYLDAGDMTAARELLEEKRAMFSGNYLWRMLWALLLAVEGKREAALEAMDDDTLKFAAAAFPSTVGVAEFYGVLGDTPKAIEWLERTVRNGDERTAWFRASPRLAGIRQDPRFQQIITSVESRRKGQK